MRTVIDPPADSDAPTVRTERSAATRYFWFSPLGGSNPTFARPTSQLSRRPRMSRNLVYAIGPVAPLVPGQLPRDHRLSARSLPPSKPSCCEGSRFSLTASPGTRPHASLHSEILARHQTGANGRSKGHPSALGRSSAPATASSRFATIVSGYSSTPVVSRGSHSQRIERPDELSSLQRVEPYKVQHQPDSGARSRQ
jgi:hypothetical protein